MIYHVTCNNLLHLQQLAVIWCTMSLATSCQSVCITMSLATTCCTCNSLLLYDLPCHLQHLVVVSLATACCGVTINSLSVGVYNHVTCNNLLLFLYTHRLLLTHRHLYITWFTMSLATPPSLTNYILYTHRLLLSHRHLCCCRWHGKSYYMIYQKMWFTMSLATPPSLTNYILYTHRPVDTSHHTI